MQYENFEGLLSSLTAVGTESVAPETVLTPEEEARLDIAIESEIDTTQEAMYVAGLEEVQDQIGTFGALLLNREAQMSINAEKSFESICKEFGMDINEIGMEAITDVAARHAYAGIASLKSLISKAITYLQNLLGYGATFKKVMKGLETKAKNEIKAMAKYSGKDMSKLKKSMPDYVAGLNKFFDEVKDVKNGTNGYKTMVDSWKSADVKKLGKKTTDASITKAETKIVEIKATISKINDGDYYDKSDTTEYENSEAYTKCVNVLNEIKSKASSNTSGAKNSDFDTVIRKSIDDLKKLRKDIIEDKKITDEKTIESIMKTLSIVINRMSQEQKLLSTCTKKIIGICDDAFTMARSIQASL